MKINFKYPKWLKEKVRLSWRLILQYTIAPPESPKEEKTWRSWSALLRYAAKPPIPADRKKLWVNWRLFLQYVTRPLRLGKKDLRRTFSGRIGLRSAYVIHTGPPVSSKENLQEQVSTLLKDSEQRFQEGAFFGPIADQVDHSHAIVTGRLSQGEEDERADAVFAVFPVGP